MELYPAERELVISWVQKSCDLSQKSVYCVPLNKLLRLLRMSKVSDALRDAESLLQRDYDFVIQNKKDVAAHKCVYLTLEGAITFCAYVHSRKMYEKRVYQRALACAAYIRETLQEMQDTLESVRRVAVLDGLSGLGTKLDRKTVTDAVIKYKADHKGGIVDAKAIHESLAAKNV